MKDIVIINGSPRGNGNCAYLTNQLKIQLPKALPAEIAQDNIHIVSPVTHDIGPCIGCEKCLTSKTRPGHCVISDDFNQLIDLLDTASALIWITPLYFGSVSSQLKAIVDRFQSLWARNYLAGDPKGIAKDRSRPAMAVYVCGHNDPFATQGSTGAALLSLKYASNTAGFTLGAAKHKGKGNVIAITGPDSPGDIAQDYYAAPINDVVHMATDMIWEAK